MALGQASNPLEAEDGKAVTVSGPEGAASVRSVDERLLAALEKNNTLLEEIRDVLLEVAHK